MAHWMTEQTIAGITYRKYSNGLTFAWSVNKANNRWIGSVIVKQGDILSDAYLVKYVTDAPDATDASHRELELLSLVDRFGKLAPVPEIWTKQ